MINYTISFLLVSIFAVIGHITFCFFNKRISSFESDFKKLLYHWRLTAFIWIVLSPLGFLFDIFLLSELNQMRISWPIFIIYTLSIYIMLFFLYLTVYYTIDRSVSSKMMTILMVNKEKKISKSVLFDKFDIDAKYHNILLGMCQGGFVRNVNGRYILTFKGKIVGYIAVFFKKMLRLGKGG